MSEIEEKDKSGILAGLLEVLLLIAILVGIGWSVLGTKVEWSKIVQNSEHTVEQCTVLDKQVSSVATRYKRTELYIKLELENGCYFTVRCAPENIFNKYNKGDSIECDVYRTGEATYVRFKESKYDATMLREQLNRYKD